MVEDFRSVLAVYRRMETERTILREFRETDPEAMFEYASDDECTKFLTWPTHTDQTVTLGVIQEMFLGHPEVYCIELKSEQKCIGGIDLRIDTTNEKLSFGYVLNRSHWNQGLMTEVVKRVLALSFGPLDLHRVEAQHYRGNEASGRVMEKAGMIREGMSPQFVKVKGRFQDMVHYGAVRNSGVAGTV